MHASRYEVGRLDSRRPNEPAVTTGGSGQSTAILLTSRTLTHVETSVSRREPFFSTNVHRPRIRRLSVESKCENLHNKFSLFALIGLGQTRTPLLLLLSFLTQLKFSVIFCLAQGLMPSSPFFSLPGQGFSSSGPQREAPTDRQTKYAKSTSWMLWTRNCLSVLLASL